MVRHPEKAEPTTKKLRAKDRPLANDFVSDEEFDRLLHAWFGNMARVLLPGRGFYIWGGYANIGNYPPVLKASGLYFSQAIIWDKQHPVLTRKDFMGCMRWCFLWLARGGRPPVLRAQQRHRPVDASRRSTRRHDPFDGEARRAGGAGDGVLVEAGENVLDLFGGSGSTLIAAEQTGRRAFLMEIDPLYCDVIVQRWEQFTGKKAQRLGTAAS